MLLNVAVSAGKAYEPVEELQRITAEDAAKFNKYCCYHCIANFILKALPQRKEIHEFTQRKMF